MVYVAYLLMQLRCPLALPPVGDFGIEVRSGFRGNAAIAEGRHGAQGPGSEVRTAAGQASDLP